MVEDTNEDYYYEEAGEKDECPTAPLEPLSKDDAPRQMHRGHIFEMPLINLSKRNVTEVKECYLVLFDKFMTYKVVADYELAEDNDLTDSLDWKPMKANYRWTRMRKDIVDVSMFYDNTEKKYGVSMSFSGGSVPDSSWYYDKGKEAKKIHDVLQNYLITRDVKIE